MASGARAAALLVMFAALTAAATLAELPWRPFQPMNVQIMVVLLSGVVLGRVLGPASQALFIAAGLVGLPIFDRLAHGLPHPALFASPDFIRVTIKLGYLAGFVLASFITGQMVAGKKQSLLDLLLTLTTAVVAVYVSGLFYFSLILNLPLRVGFLGAMSSFLLLDLVKAALVALFVVRLTSIGLSFPVFRRPGPDY